MLQAEEDLLVLAAQDGNHKAFNFLISHYHKALLRFGYKISSDKELVNDAVQDAWIKSVKNLHKLEDPRAFKSWIYRMVRWQITDLFRQQTHRRELFEVKLDDSFDESTILNEQANKYDLGHENELTKTINRLPQIEKQIIHLFYLDEMKLTEVAMVLEIPLGTVKSRLNRARKLLKQKFELT